MCTVDKMKLLADVNAMSAFFQERLVQIKFEQRAFLFSFFGTGSILKVEPRGFTPLLSFKAEMHSKSTRKMLIHRGTNPLRTILSVGPFS
jgi:hypothetical protein